jgi:hypothetical protein
MIQLPPLHNLLLSKGTIMITTRYMLIVLMGSLLGAQAQEPKPAPEATPTAAAVDCRKPIPVPPELKVIEEATLCMDGALATGDPTQLERQRSNYTRQSDPGRGMTGLTTRTHMEDMESSGANALRIYNFTLKPNEELKAKLQAEDDKIMMRFLTPKSVDERVQDIRRANNTPTAVRRSRISIKNTSKNDADFALMLYGAGGHKYRLELEHTGGK